MLSIALGLIGVSATPRLQAQNIYTYAGIANTAGYSGNDSLATLARMAGPAGIAVGPTGNVYVADSRNNVVRVIDGAHIIRTFAGMGTAGYAGDGGPATAAQLRNPTAVTVDAAGNVYIADSRNNVVRMVSAAGVISTVAGNNTAGYAGDGGPATAAQLRNPSGVAVDATGNIYVSDTRNFVVRKVSAGIISTIAGNNTPGYSGDGGAATAAQLARPLGLTIDAAGNIYVADAWNNRVRRISATGAMATFAGSGALGHSGDGGPATAAAFASPSDVKTDAAGNVFISDSGNTVRMVNTANVVSAFAGTGAAGYSGDGGLATLARFSGPTGLAIDAAHNVYISATGNNVVRRVGDSVAGISITSSMGDTVCLGGATIHFIATPIADSDPHYQWQLNGANAGVDSFGFTTALVRGDRVRCVLTTSAGVPLAMSKTMVVDSFPANGTITGPTSLCVGVSTMLRVIGVPPGPGGLWVSSDTTVATMGTPPGRVTALNVGADTIYYITTNGCGSSTASLPIVVVPNTIGAISGPLNVCEGATAVYTDTTAGGQWRINRPAMFGVIDSVSGSFTAGFRPGPLNIIYATSAGCFVTLNIMVDSLPVVGPITGATTVDSGATITLTDPTSPGGVWTSGNTSIATVGSSSGIVTGTGSGVVTITYTITNAAGCSADTTYDITVVNTTGIAQVGAAAGISMYPNPTHNTLTVTANGATGTVVITDITGRIAYTGKLQAGAATTLDVSGLNAGLYFISVATANGAYTGKVEKLK